MKTNLGFGFWGHPKNNDFLRLENEILTALIIPILTPQQIIMKRQKWHIRATIFFEIFLSELPDKVR